MGFLSGLKNTYRAHHHKSEPGVENSVVRIKNPRSGNESYPNQIVNSVVRIERMGMGCRINNAEIKGNVDIGDFVSVWGPNIKIASQMAGIRIGSFSSIALNCVMLDYNHRFDRPTSYFILKNLFKEENVSTGELSSNGPIVLEEDVWIGAGCIVLSGVTVGRGSVIGAGSVVTKSIPPYSIAFGNPAKPFKSRFSPDRIEYLENLRWWEWNIEKILGNKEFFSSPVDPETVRPRE